MNTDFRGRRTTIIRKMGVREHRLFTINTRKQHKSTRTTHSQTCTRYSVAVVAVVAAAVVFVVAVSVPSCQW